MRNRFALRWLPYAVALTMVAAVFVSTGAMAAPVDGSPEGSQPTLRAALLIRLAVDQALRDDLIASGLDHPDAAQWKRIAVVDAGNTAWMRKVVATFGWPTRALVGIDGAKAAFVLVQHADAAPAFQRRCLTLIEHAAPGEVDGETMALLTDRVLLAQGRKQRYGSQLGGTCTGGGLVPKPIDDEAHVDARRAVLGLPPLQTYQDDANRFLCATTPSPST